MSEKIIVGIPFHEDEGQDTFEITARDLDSRLNEIGVDASIVFCINGLKTSCGSKKQPLVNRSLYNSDITTIANETPGQIAAMEKLSALAITHGSEKIFFTDTDISRLPFSLQNMWEDSQAAPETKIIGANYSPYPIEVVRDAYPDVAISPQDELLYKIFDGDKTPQAVRALAAAGYNRSPRVKGSLMLVDAETSLTMHGAQRKAADSIMNRNVAPSDIKISPDAHFMHMGRTDMTDHISARLRHFQAAIESGGVDKFAKKEVQLPTDTVIDSIAHSIRQNEDQGDYFAMLYLSRCAIRERVNTICRDIALKQWNPSALPQVDPRSMQDIHTISDARKICSRFFIDVNWDQILGNSKGAPSITQIELRQPIPLDDYLQDAQLRNTIFHALGINNSTPN